MFVGLVLHSTHGKRWQQREWVLRRTHNRTRTRWYSPFKQNISTRRAIVEFRWTRKNQRVDDARISMLDIHNL